ncbi:protein of unknown function [Mucilaginibacter mallensis]|uniref:DUF3885 domain-containing protein n=1 Tax=Mucilaginibacter mallensis TaxID=652787 RepID=A0A1H2BC84_MUCMA|nr:DUF3885 domain-containing protein [Mucilaginibacter mallensis]SDT55764.1 protein of unknown function [Mucilaginibacter mallensis]
MSLSAELKIYLDVNFKGLKLFRPLFFAGAFGLRFDLQDAVLETSEDAYFEEVVRRMDKIHAITTTENDDILLLYRKDTYKRRKIRLANYLFKQISKNATIELKRRRTPFYDYEGVNASVRSCQVLIKDSVNNINFHNLYVAISNMDFGRSPVLEDREGELYIINLTRNTVTIMYDDRGCDIISYDVSLLKEYYNQLSDLILEVNRPEIINKLNII